MVMVGGVEIAVDLNLEGIEQTLKELDDSIKKIKKIELTPSQENINNTKTFINKSFSSPIPLFFSVDQKNLKDIRKKISNNSSQNRRNADFSSSKTSTDKTVRTSSGVENILIEKSGMLINAVNSSSEKMTEQITKEIKKINGFSIIRDTIQNTMQSANLVLVTRAGKQIEEKGAAEPLKKALDTVLSGAIDVASQYIDTKKIDDAASNFVTILNKGSESFQKVFHSPSVESVMDTATASFSSIQKEAKDLASSIAEKKKELDLIDLFDNSTSVAPEGKPSLPQEKALVVIEEAKRQLKAAELVFKDRLELSATSREEAIQSLNNFINTIEKNVKSFDTKGLKVNGKNFNLSINATMSRLKQMRGVIAEQQDNPVKENRHVDQKEVGEIANKGVDLPGLFTNSLKSLDVSSFQGIGQNIVDSIMKGVDTSFLLDLGKTIGESLITGIKTILQINSPSKVFEQIGHYIVEGLSLGLNTLSTVGDTSFSDLRLSIKVWTDKIIDDIKNTPDNFSFFYKNLTENLDVFLKKTKTKIKRFIRDFPGLLVESFDKIEPALLQLDSDIDSFFNNLSIDSVKEVGKNIITGITKGIEIPLLQNIGKTIGEEITESTKSTLQINSPSKVFEQIGAFLVDGLKKGFSENINVFVSEIGKDLKIDPKKLLAPITALLSGEIKKSIKGFTSLIKKLLSELTEDIDNFAIAHVKKIANNISKEIPVLFSELQDDLNTIGGHLKWLFLGEGDDFEEIGSSIAKGVKKGIAEEGISGIGEEIGKTITDEAKEVLEINSPSGVFKWIGQQIVKGLSSGMATINSALSQGFNVSDVIKKASSLAQKIKNTIDKTSKKISLQVEISTASLSNKFSFGNGVNNLITKTSKQMEKELEKMLLLSSQLDKSLVSTEEKIDSLYRKMEEETDETEIERIRKEIDETLIALKKLEDQKFNIEIKTGEIGKIDKIISGLSLINTTGPKTKEQIKEIENQIKTLQANINDSVYIESPRINNIEQQGGAIPGEDTIKELPSLLQGIVPLAGSILAISAIRNIPFLDEIKSFAGVGIALSIEFQSMSLAINFLEGSAEKGAKKIKELKSLSNEMGVSFKTIGKGYKQLAASTRNTALEGQVTEDLTKSLAQAGRVFGLTSDEIEGSFLAISQMAGKGTVSAEELRGQLAERIPGAFQIAARAMKMTEKELFQLMATGNMASTTFLPAFAKQLDIETKGGLSGGTKSLASDIERFNTALADVQITIGSALGPIQQLFTKIGTAVLSKANESLLSTLAKIPFILAGGVLAMGKGLSSLSKITSLLMGLFGKLIAKIGLTAVAGNMSASLFYKGWAFALTTIGKMLVVFLAKTALFTLAFEGGIGIFKVFQAEFGKSTVYDQWADNIESNVDRVNEAIKTSLISMTQLSKVKPSNQIASSGNWWLEMGENALGLVGMDSRSQLDKAVKKENEKRAKEGKAPVSQAEIQSAIDKRDTFQRAQWNQFGGGTRQKDKAIVTREKLSRMRDENFYNPIQTVMEQYKFSNAGPLAEIEQLEKKIKGLKAQQAVLDPADVETAQKLTKEIGLAEKAKQELLGPLDAVESGLRQSLKDDQEMLDKYNQAIADQNSDDKEKRKAAEEFLRQPGHDPQSMEQVSRDIDQTTTALNNYQREQARSGAVNDTKKLAMAMMELGIAFGSVEKRINAIHIGKLKGIAQLQVKGFSSDQFNDTNTGLRTAEENYNNTQRLLKERKATMKRLEADLALNPTKTASDQLIAAEEEKRGRKLTGEEVNMLADIYAKEGQEQLKQALTAEASLRDERLKNLELEKQSVEDIYNIRQARQAHYLAIYEDAIDEIKQLDQRNLSNAMTGANNQLARGLRSDLGAEDAFNVKTTGMQYIKVQKDIENNALAMKSLQQAYYEGKLSLEQYTTKSRALLTEDAQLKQQLVEQEISYIKAVSQARMNALQRIKESRDANTEIANSGRTEAITKNSISKFRTDEFLSNNESLAQAKNGLVEIQNQLKNTNSELSELEEAYASGDLLLNDYIQKKRQLLITQAQQESQLATAEMTRMRAIEDYRLAMLDRMRDVSNNKNAILNAEALTQLAQSQMTGQVGDSQASRQSTEIALDNAKKTVEVAKESLAGIQKAYRKKELSAEKYQERLRAINLEIAQANQSVAEQELALWKAKEQEKISILEKSLERQDRLNKLNAIKTKINNTEQLAGMLASGGTSDLTSSIFSNQETNVSQDQSISSLTNKLAGLKGIVNPTKDLQDKILATEQELNEAVLTKRLNLLSQSLEYKKQMLNATQLENKSIENQLNMIDSQHKLQQAFVEITKKRLENEIVSMERIKTLSDEIGSSSIESVQSRSQFDDAIASKRLKTLDIELKANVRNVEIEQHREKLSQRKAENESRLAVIQAKNSLLIANQSGNNDAIALAQQQFQLANESLSTVLRQGQAINQLHDTQKTKLALEHQGTLQAEKYAKIQDTINSKLKTANSYLDKQKERLDSINELNKAINNARTNVLEKQTGISDRKIDLYDTINGTEKVTDPKQNAVLMKELEAQLKAIGGSTDPEAMYSERLRLEESLANQKMNALVAEQNMQKTLLQIEFDKYELQAQALILQAKMLALQSKGTENEASANQILDDALKSLEQLQDRKDKAMDALGVTQETERYNQGIENANAINDTRRKSAEAGYRPKGDPAKYPTATGEAGKVIKELLTGNSQRFGYAPSFDLNQAVKGLRGGNGIDIGRVNIPSPSNEPTYTPLNINEELLTPNLTENTERNTKAMYDLSNSIISLTEALVNNKPGLEINAPVANNNPVSTPTGQPTTTGGQQVINNVNYGGVTVISSDPTGDARKVLNDLAKANKNKL